MKYFDEIEKYLNGELNSLERENFELRLRNEPELRSAYKRHLEVYNALRDSDLIDFRRKMGEIGEDFKEGKGRKGKPGAGFLFSWVTASAAVVLILIAIMVLFWLIPRHHQKIAAGNDNDKTGQSWQLPDSYFKMKALVLRGSGEPTWAPADSTVFDYGRPVTFRFAVEPDTNLMVEVTHVKDGLVFRDKVTSGATLSMINPLKTGVYFYKVTSSDSLLYIGYFLVEE